jgi:hypothetical protein
VASQIYLAMAAQVRQGAASAPPDTAPLHSRCLPLWLQLVLSSHGASLLAPKYIGLAQRALQYAVPPFMLLLTALPLG